MGDTEKEQVADTEARIKMHRDTQKMARHFQRQTKGGKADRNSRLWRT